MRSNPETRLQCAMVRDLRAMLRPPAVVMHVKNEGRLPGKTPTDRAKMGEFWKRMGVTAGVPDLLVMWPGGSAWLELKAPKGRLSDAQEGFHAALVAVGQPVALVRTVDEALAALEGWGAPVRLLRAAA